MTQLQSDGLNVLTVDATGRNLSGIQLWVKTGSADEGDKERGISHLIEKLAFAGTPKGSKQPIAKEIERLGGETNAYTTWDETVFGVTVPSRAIPQGLALLLRGVLGPLPSQQAFQKVKQDILQEIQAAEESPHERARQLMFETAYASSGYRFPLIGLKQTVERLTIKDIEAFRKKWYQPENMFLVVAGDFKSADVVAEVKRLTARLNPGGLASHSRQAEPVLLEPLVALRAHPQSENTIVHYAFHIPSVQSIDTSAVDLTAEILGGGAGSRLDKALRQDKGLVHTVSAYTLTARDTGLLVVAAELDADKVEDVTKLVTEQIGDLAKKPPSEEELERARLAIERRETYAGETVGKLARRIGQSYADHGDPGYWEKYVRLNAAVTPQEISAVAAKYLAPRNMTLTMLTPEAGEEKIQQARLTKILSELGASEAFSVGKEATSPSLVYRVLPNGTQVAALRDDANPLVSVYVGFVGGKRAETTETQGIMNLIASLITKGNETITEAELKKAVARIGGQLKTFTGDDTLGVSLTCFSRFTDDGLRLIADLIKGQTFPVARFEQERNRIIDEIGPRSGQSAPGLSKLLYTTLYKAHPYGFDSEGQLQTIMGITDKDVRKTYESLTGPRNTVVACVGAIDLPKTVDLIAELFGNIPDRAVDLPAPVVEVSDPPFEEILVKDSCGAGVAFGFRGPKYTDTERFALEILDKVLATENGRLARKLSASGIDGVQVSSFVRPGMESGLIAIQTGCKSSEIESVSKLVRNELDQVRSQLVRPEEIAEAARLLENERIKSGDTSWSRAQSMALNTLFGLGHDYDDTYASQLASVTPEQVRTAAQTYLDPQHCVVVRILPPENARKGE